MTIPSLCAGTGIPLDAARNRKDGTMDGTVRLNQEPVDQAHLGVRLARLFRAAPDHVIFVRARRESSSAP